MELNKSIIICTSNYKSEDDIKSHLGNAIFSRFDAIIHFSSLAPEAKREIANMKYDEKIQHYSVNDQEILRHAGLRERLVCYSEQCSNAREISRLIDQTFSLLLINELLGKKAFDSVGD